MSSLLFFFLFLGWCSNFVASEYGQKQSVKFLQNMVYNTTNTPPPTATHTLRLLWEGGTGGGGQREGRGATVPKRGSKIQT
jgi:hypothetical protein